MPIRGPTSLPIDTRASLAALMLGCSDATSWAQQNIAAVEEVTVTARRREEKNS